MTLIHIITRLIGEGRRQTMHGDREDALPVLAAKRTRRDRSEITRSGCGEKEHLRSESPQGKRKRATRETVEVCRRHASITSVDPLHDHGERI